VKATTPESIEIASVLDERFNNDAQFPNIWRKIDPQADKGMELGPPQPYAGLGNYVRVTQLKSPVGALFVEIHTIYHEPQGWFDGFNLIRSKLPLVTKDNVASFRRKLAQAEK
jgi:hypothetical protein